eukprot:SAG31_NODE_1379_length_8582_cov_17.482848_5_plen_246_part_00
MSEVAFSLLCNYSRNTGLYSRKCHPAGRPWVLKAAAAARSGAGTHAAEGSEHVGTCGGGTVTHMLAPPADADSGCHWTGPGKRFTVGFASTPPAKGIGLAGPAGASSFARPRQPQPPTSAGAASERRRTRCPQGGSDGGIGADEDSGRAEGSGHEGRLATLARPSPRGLAASSTRRRRHLAHRLLALTDGGAAEVPDERRISARGRLQEDHTAGGGGRTERANPPLPRRLFVPSDDSLAGPRDSR